MRINTFQHETGRGNSTKLFFAIIFFVAFMFYKIKDLNYRARKPLYWGKVTMLCVQQISANWGPESRFVELKEPWSSG